MVTPGPSLLEARVLVRFKDRKGVMQEFAKGERSHGLVNSLYRRIPPKRKSKKIAEPKPFVAIVSPFK